MKSDSESTKAIERIIRADFNTEPVFDVSHGPENLTFRSDGRRYRVYVEEEFEEDFPATKQQYERVLHNLSADLRLSKTRAVIVARSGIKEHPGADF